MIGSVSTPPRINVYRTDDGRRYIFMELARVEPGHYVGWGKLRIMDRAEAMNYAHDYVVNSLREFSFRNGKNKAKRLSVKGMEPFHLHCDLVSIEVTTATALQLVPYRREKTQYERLEDRRVTLETDIAPIALWSRLEGAFENGKT